MTALLQEAFQQTQTLSDDAQDWLAALLLENVRRVRQTPTPAPTLSSLRGRYAHLPLNTTALHDEKQRDLERE